MLSSFAEQLSKKFKRQVPVSDIPLDEIQLMRFPANGFSHSSGNEFLVYSPSLKKFFEKDVYEADELMVSLGRAFPQEISYVEVAKELVQIKVLAAQNNMRKREKENCLKAGLTLNPAITISQKDSVVSVEVLNNSESPFVFKDEDFAGNVKNAAHFIWAIADSL